MNQPMIDGIMTHMNKPIHSLRPLFYGWCQSFHEEICPGHIPSHHRNHGLNSRTQALSKGPLCQAVLISAMFILNTKLGKM